MSESIRQKICNEFGFLEGVVSEYYLMKIVDKACECYSEGVDEGCRILDEELNLVSQNAWEEGYNEGFKDGQNQAEEDERWK